MTASQEPSQPGKNRLLAALPKRERDRLLPHLESVNLGFEEVLYEPDEPIRHVYFPTSGIVSLLLILEDGLGAEVSRIGNEGLIGLPIFFGVKTSHTRALVQIPGATFYDRLIVGVVVIVIVVMDQVLARRHR